MMKNTIKVFTATAIAAATLFGTKVKAQGNTPASKWRLGIGVEGGAVTGNLNNYADGLVGGTLRLQYGLTNHTALTLTGGYYNAFGKNIPYTDNAGKYESMGLVPVRVGAKLYLGTKIYVIGEAGAGVETKENYRNQAKDVKFALSPGLGYSFKHVDIGFHYDAYMGQDNTYGLIALRLAYGFSL